MVDEILPHTFVPGPDDGCLYAPAPGELCPWLPHHWNHWWAGPEVDGHPTWFSSLAQVPSDCEWRQGPEAGAWHKPGPDGDQSRWVQVRRRPLPQPSDRVFVHDQHHRGVGVGVEVTFAQVCEAVVFAMPDRELVPGEDFAEPEHSVALAVWALLTDG